MPLYVVEYWYSASEALKHPMTITRNFFLTTSSEWMKRLASVPEFSGSKPAESRAEFFALLIFHSSLTVKIKLPMCLNQTP
jgi:hypothetical protein